MILADGVTKDVSIVPWSKESLKPSLRKDQHVILITEPFSITLKYEAQNCIMSKCHLNLKKMFEWNVSNMTLYIDMIECDQNGAFIIEHE